MWNTRTQSSEHTHQTCNQIDQLLTAEAVSREININYVNYVVRLTKVFGLLRLSLTADGRVTRFIHIECGVVFRRSVLGSLGAVHKGRPHRGEGVGQSRTDADGEGVCGHADRGSKRLFFADILYGRPLEVQASRTYRA